MSGSSCHEKHCGEAIHNKFVSEQDQNAGNSGINTFRVSKSLGVRCDLWHFQQSQHGDGSILLARYDFLLVFYSHSRSVVKQLQARKSVGLIRASKRRNVSSFVLHAFSALTLLVERQEEHPACKN